MTRLLILAVVACALSVLPACRGARTDEASAEEIQLAARVLTDYQQAAAEPADDERPQGPDWLVRAQQVEVLGVEKMKNMLKVRVRFSYGANSTTRYAILQKGDGGRYAVAGFLGSGP